jgi:hypothetical protein
MKIRGCLKPLVQHLSKIGVVGKIRQLMGDSATWDFTPHRGSCSLVFVDGSRAYENVASDSRAAMDLLAVEGVVVWHDSGIWSDVTAVLQDLEQKGRYGLRHIRGPSLVFWRKPG